jgi:hypothetical protein
MLSSPHAFVLGLFQQGFARRVQRKPNTVIEGGPIYFFDLERGLIGKGIEIVLMKFKTNCRTNLRTYHIWEMYLLVEPFPCLEIIPLDYPFSVSVCSDF